MELIFFGMIILGIMVTVYTAIGTTLSELSAHTVSMAQLRHPHSRKWRKRPSVAIVTDPADPLPKIGYRNSVVTHTHSTVTELILRIPLGMTIDKAALRQAIMSLNAQPTKQSIGILPTPQQPTTLRRLLHQYRAILSAPFTQAASGLGVGVASPYHMTATSLRATKKDIVFAIAKPLTATMHVLFIGYSLYAATFLQRPELLLTYTAGFTLWAIWAIGTYPRVSLPQKFTYFGLLPAAIPYLLWRALTQPFSQLRNR